MRPVAFFAGAAGERRAPATGALAHGFSGGSVAVGVEHRGETRAHVRLHANHDAGQGRKPGVNASANAASPDKLLERMLGGAGEPAAPFGLIRDERRTAKSATLKLERDLASRLRDRAAALNISMESLVCLAWSLVLARFCGQDSVTFGAALPPLTKAVPVRIDAATSPGRDRGAGNI